MIKDAFQRLFPDKELKYRPILKYNKKLGDFNANIKLHYNTLQINMNYKWQEIDEEIQIGLIQTLLMKMFAKRFRVKGRKNTFNMDLYNNFIKNIPMMTPKTKVDPKLEDSFNRVSEQFFGDLEMPNLVWGTASRRKLACYNFHSDTVTVSTLFQDADEKILDYLMYHELLHKKQQFKAKNNRNYFHTREFKEAEDRFPDKKQMEKEINKIIRKPKKKSFLDQFAQILLKNR